MSYSLALLPFHVFLSPSAISLSTTASFFSRLLLIMYSPLPTQVLFPEYVHNVTTDLAVLFILSFKIYFCLASMTPFPNFYFLSKCLLSASSSFPLFKFQVRAIPTFYLNFSPLFIPYSLSEKSYPLLHYEMIPKSTFPGLA